MCALLGLDVNRLAISAKNLSGKNHSGIADDLIEIAGDVAGSRMFHEL